MERNTVIIDLGDYNDLLIKAEKYNEFKKKGYKLDDVISKERSIVNIKVKNEADIPAIKACIEEENDDNDIFKYM